MSSRIVDVAYLEVVKKSPHKLLEKLPATSKVRQVLEDESASAPRYFIYTEDKILVITIYQTGYDYFELPR